MQRCIRPAALRRYPFDTHTCTHLQMSIGNGNAFTFIALPQTFSYQPKWSHPVTHIGSATAKKKINSQLSKYKFGKTKKKSFQLPKLLNFLCCCRHLFVQQICIECADITKHSGNTAVRVCSASPCVQSTFTAAAPAPDWWRHNRRRRHFEWWNGIASARSVVHSSLPYLECMRTHLLWGYDLRYCGWIAHWKINRQLHRK